MSLLRVSVNYFSLFLAYKSLRLSSEEKEQYRYSIRLLRDKTSLNKAQLPYLKLISVASTHRSLVELDFSVN